MNIFLKRYFLVCNSCTQILSRICPVWPSEFYFFWSLNINPFIEILALRFNFLFFFAIFGVTKLHSMSVVESYLSHNSRSSKRIFFFNLENSTIVFIASFAIQKYINLDIFYLSGMCYNQKNYLKPLMVKYYIYLHFWQFIVSFDLSPCFSFNICFYICL